MNSTTTINANLNSADCIKSSDQFSQTTYYNICTGQQNVVPTGSFDYMVGIPFLIMLVIGVLWAVIGSIKVLIY